MRLSERMFYRYHCRTKHTVESLMSGGHYLDWANQPHPFRHYHGAPPVELERNLSVSADDYFTVLEYFWSAIDKRCDLPLPNIDYRPESLLSNLLFYAMSISAWKQVRGTNSRWALRVNASSGNLHPTETHIVVRSLPGVAPGVYHYVVNEHRLEMRAAGDRAQALWKLLSVGEGDDQLCPPVFICLTSILWREIWKYRQRGFRYCQHDMGHALGSCLVSAAALGWRADVKGIFPDRDAASILALEEGDEVPGLIIALRPDERWAQRFSTDPSSSSEVEPAKGEGNELSAEQIEYPIVTEVQNATSLSAEQCRTIAGALSSSSDVHESRPQTLVPCADEILLPYDHERARELIVDRSVHKTIRRRRSAVDMDGKRRMSLDQLALILNTSTRGFDADFQKPIRLGEQDGHYLIDLYLYIHRVEGLTPGLYFFDRRKSCLVPLLLTDQKEVSKGVSCFQDIACDGCFALSMIADFNTASALYGERGYRLVHHEAGMIGQLLYLCATALGFDSTGIGCFVDDAINQYLALPEGEEVIYNFTFGGAVQDPRLTTLASYDFHDPALD